MPIPFYYSRALGVTSLIFVLITMTASCGSRHTGSGNSGCQSDSDCATDSVCNTSTGFCEGQAVDLDPASGEEATPADDTSDTQDNQDDETTTEDPSEEAADEPVEPTNPTLIITRSQHADGLKPGEFIYLSIYL